MRIKNIALIGSAIIPLLSGCMSGPTTALSPVGPDPASSAGTGANGSLVVFSATEIRAKENTPTDYPAYSHPHSGYDIKDATGRTMKFVRNKASFMDSQPDRVVLAPGNYDVVAQSACCGLVDVPVVIQPGKITVVHLDGNWQHSASASSNQLVHLPNGESVGWSSSSTKPSN